MVRTNQKAREKGAYSLGYDGTEVSAAVIDSGVNPVWDLTQAGTSKVSRIVYSQNFDPSPSTTNDLYSKAHHCRILVWPTCDRFHVPNS